MHPRPAPLTWVSARVFALLWLADTSISSFFAAFQLGFALETSGVAANRRISHVVWAVAGAMTILFFINRFTGSYAIRLPIELQPSAGIAGNLSLLGSVAIIAWDYCHND
ncbi:hypothetical protein GRI89_10685 [Altererythrobacter salegens]|uniref:Uncharacterized protein n=1 Tax=Croceibacterium salegens TaxID=1737568 RepID=A0A6I4SV15_9SPHN|nr:hypothetical protein [Croceibacterium salegens]MXO60004.1 hypothetical protein [Croceibacterium salegens]